jgi:N-acetylmuramoyl-L-alanine amidase
MGRKQTNRIVVHSLATDPDWHGPITVQQIRIWHMKDRGWRDIGYHVYIDRQGVAWPGRPFGAIGAHALGYNADSFGIALEGGAKAAEETNTEGVKIIRLHPCNNFTPKQLQTLATLIALKLWAEPSIKDVCGHRDLPGCSTDCPSFDVREWWENRHESRMVSRG